jgi:peptidoglycan hydrolase-like protein with peptidoglycan-binding domain
MRRRQRWVLVIAALVGLVGGVTTAVLAPGASDPGTVATEVNDPLRLGIPQVSLSSCTDESVLVLGAGDSEAALTPIVSDAGSGARYLRTDESCQTLWSDGDELPSYVVYRGPYDSMVEPCRASLEDDGDVTNLSEGNEQFVMCACVLPTAELAGIVPPGQLAAGEEPAPVPWVRMLQRLLDVEVTGAYESDTVSRVRQFQESNGILPADGKVGERTWGALREQRCGSFDF